MNIDPRVQDMYVMPLMSTEWHVWKAGNPKSACGLPWSVVSMAWDSQADRPKEHLCDICAVSENE